MRCQSVQPKVSIIVPVYNAEKYLEQCLKSLVSQTLKEIEIIVVNDGSTDESRTIILDYANRDSRIIPLNQSNAGVSLARKKGILEAKGEYIGFVDSDDWVDDNMFMRLYSVATQENADVVECNKHGDIPTAGYGVFSQSEFRDKIAKPHLLCGQGSSVLWNRIYRNTSFLSQIDYGSHLTFEDYLFNIQFFCQVKKYVKLADCLYHYRFVLDSLSNRYNENTLVALKYSRQMKLQLLSEYGWTAEADLLADAHWFTQNTLNIINVLLCSDRSSRFKIKEINRISSDMEVKSVLSLLKQSQQIDAHERRLLSPTWLVIRTLLIKQIMNAVKRFREIIRKQT
jgi:glycosyltransferase involved in cell wall biosynthesis